MAIDPEDYIQPVYDALVGSSVVWDHFRRAAEGDPQRGESSWMKRDRLERAEQIQAAGGMEPFFLARVRRLVLGRWEEIQAAMEGDKIRVYRSIVIGAHRDDPAMHEMDLEDQEEHWKGYHPWGKRNEEGNYWSEFSRPLNLQSLGACWSMNEDGALPYCAAMEPGQFALMVCGLVPLSEVNWLETFRTSSTYGGGEESEVNVNKGGRIFVDAVWESHNIHHPEEMTQELRNLEGKWYTA